MAILAPHKSRPEEVTAPRKTGINPRAAQTNLKRESKMFLFRKCEVIGGALVVGLLVVSCGGGSSSAGGGGGNGGSAGGSYSWSVSTESSGNLVTCVNYTNQKVSAAQAMTTVQGGTVSADPCPAMADMVGVCSGVDAGGNDFQQVYYNYSGLTGDTLTAAVQNLMLGCTGIGGTWTTTYNGLFSPSTAGGAAGGGGTSGGGGGGAGGSTGACAQLLACCNVASSAYKTACMAAYTATEPDNTSCSSAYAGIRAAFCPSH